MGSAETLSLEVLHGQDVFCVVLRQLREKHGSLGSHRLLRHLGHYLKQDNEDEVCLAAEVAEFFASLSEDGVTSVCVREA